MKKSHKLTKKFLMSLEEGLFLISNKVFTPHEPCFAGYIAPMKQREEQWKLIKESNADQDSCMLFQNQAAFEEMVTRFGPR